VAYIYIYIEREREREKERERERKRDRERENMFKGTATKYTLQGWAPSDLLPPTFYLLQFPPSLNSPFKYELINVLIHL
jgi:hypothetical protein